MFGARWNFCRLLGIPIFVDASWLIILALLTLSFAGGFPAMLHQLDPEAVPLAPYEYWAMGLVSALCFFVCILLHELGHAVVARARGMRIRGITLFLFGGVAEIGDEPPSAATEFLMAIAGPLVSAVLAILFLVLASVGLEAHWPDAIVIVLGYLGTINAIVLAFNLIPAFPLDGGRVLRSILWGATRDLRRSTYWASLAGQVFSWCLMGLGVVQFFTGNWLGGIWMGLIGMFLGSAARSGYQQVLLQQALQGETVRHFMNPEPVVVSPSLDLRHWVDDYVYRYHHRAFPVTSHDRLEGLIATPALNRVPSREWGEHTVSELMTSDLRPVTIAPDTAALDALKKMQRTNTSRLLVTDDGDHLLGVVSLRDLVRFLDLKLELNGEEGR